ncbi:MAG: hypothetical protein HYT10_02030 [Candidatus Levybacteria bacterium]|nr:hypothetical protein [Candidatus Levybacteria bacterium]
MKNIIILLLQIFLMFGFLFLGVYNLLYIHEVKKVKSNLRIDMSPLIEKALFFITLIAFIGAIMTLLFLFFR